MTKTGQHPRAVGELQLWKMKLCSLLCLSLHIALPAVADETVDVLILPRCFSIKPGGLWEKEEKFKEHKQGVKLSFQGFRLKSRPDDYLYMGALDVLDPKKTIKNTGKKLGAKEMIQLMSFSLAHKTDGQQSGKKIQINHSPT